MSLAASDPRVRSLPSAAAVAGALGRLDAWLAGRGVVDVVVEALGGVADPARALANLEALIAAGQMPSAKVLPALLRVLGGSEALGASLLVVPGAGVDWIERALDVGRVTADEHVEEMLAALPSELDSPDVPVVLRRHKRKHLVRIGGRDLAGLAGVEETMREISALAEGAIEVALRHARSRVERELGPFGADDPLRFVVLAMGKLGGGELNFSSDVDLVYLYDGGRGRSAGGERGAADGAAWAARVAQLLTRTLSEVTAEGFVFRVDLRLRPEGQNGPIVDSLAAAIAYYEAWGQTWERAAMLKARSVAGDISLGETFLTEIQPFVYRRFLDFATTEEMEEMKRRVDSAHSRARLERDVKLGRGGIREVEFVVQALQLVHAGRDERLRTRATLATLAALADLGVLPRDESRALADAYCFLRNVEHKIQIVHERQTHRIPSDAEEQRLLARRLGYSSLPPGAAPPPNGALEVEAFRRDLLRHRDGVRRSFEKLFLAARDQVESSAGDDARALFAERPESVVPRLKRMGFRDTAAAADALRLLRDGPPFAPSSPRRRKALLALAPVLLSEIVRASDPDLALHHMAEFISAVGARTSFLALLREKPETLRLLVGLFGTSRYLSSFFIRHPELLDSLVRADVAAVRKDRRALERELQSVLEAANGDYEAELDALRRFRNEQFLRIGVNDIHGLVEVPEVSEQLSDLAECCLEAALEIAQRSLASRHGPPPGRFAVIAMGKLGSRELNYNSDLDLIFVYAGAPGAEAVHEYFTRLAQRLMVVLQLRTREGVIYKIDTRLRPSGSHGPLVTALAGFREYHRSSSALWERQALIRARFVAGDRGLGADVEAVIEAFVYGTSLAPDDVAAIAHLRARMERELARESDTSWNLKTGRGGLVDVEFLTQMLQLRHGREHPTVRERRTDLALDALFARGLVPEEDYRVLGGGLRFLRRLESRLRIERDQPVEAIDRAGEGLAALARRLGYSGRSEAAVRGLLDDFHAVREAVRAVYERYLHAARAS